MQYKGYIYCIKNKINNKKYIGQTYNKEGYKSRWNNHKISLKNNKHENNSLQYDYNKYSLDAFEFILLEEFTFSDKELLKKTLNDKERYYINLFDTENKNKGYNAIVPNKKLIECVETGEIFISSKDVIDKMFHGKGLSSYIRANICGRRKSAYGYHFRHVNE